MASLAILLAALGAVALLIAFVVREVGERRERRARRFATEMVDEGVRALARKHIAALVRKHRQLVYADDYGNVVDENFLREIDYFIDTVAWTAVEVWEDYLRRKGYRASYRRLAQLVVQNEVEVALGLHVDQDSFSDLMSGEEFERLCASELNVAGWTTQFTRVAGDQGVDIIAEKDGCRMVVQCKRSGRPIGNGAVQEALAGGQYDGADWACVVSNAPFTKAAKQLAATTRVRLLHYSELRTLKSTH